MTQNRRSIYQLEHPPQSSGMAVNYSDEGRGNPSPAPLSFDTFYKELEGTREREFRKFADEWKRDTLDISAPSLLFSHPAYLRIIGMGSPVIPLLLDELERSPHHWFIALHAITGENPIEGDHDADFDQISEAWLDWGRKNGYA